jgi:hypothetical protein
MPTKPISPLTAAAATVASDAAASRRTRARADAERRGFGVAEGEHVESLAHRNTAIAAIVAYSRWATPHASR